MGLALRQAQVSSTRQLVARCAGLYLMPPATLWAVLAGAAERAASVVRGCDQLSGAGAVRVPGRQRRNTVGEAGARGSHVRDQLVAACGCDPRGGDAHGQCCEDGLARIADRHRDGVESDSGLVLVLREAGVVAPPKDAQKLVHVS